VLFNLDCAIKTVRGGGEGATLAGQSGPRRQWWGAVSGHLADRTDFSSRKATVTDRRATAGEGKRKHLRDTSASFSPLRIGESRATPACLRSHASGFSVQSPSYRGVARDVTITSSRLPSTRTLTVARLNESSSSFQVKSLRLSGE